MLPGAFAAGLREWSWVQCKLGVLNFPFDFPNTPAYLQSQQEMCVEEAANARQSKSASHIPCPASWFGIMQQLDVSRELQTSVTSQIGSEDDLQAENQTQCTNDSFCVRYTMSIPEAVSGKVQFAVYLIKMDKKGSCKVGAAVREHLVQSTSEAKIIGYATTSYPRGSKRFPGGLSICWTPNQASESGVLEYRSVEVKNKGSSVWRAAHITPIIYIDWCSITL